VRRRSLAFVGRLRRVVQQASGQRTIAHLRISDLTVRKSHDSKAVPRSVALSDPEEVAAGQPPERLQSR
jgi:hypothetical protein